MNNIKLDLLGTDGKARVNRVNLNNHEFLTPIFMPVATRGSIKSLNLENLSETNIILGNTYHLYLRPGLEVIKKFNGLHDFMNWNKLILTDSGGFQGWSIPNTQTDEGILFRNVYDGSKFLMTPELSMEIQQSLNSDIAITMKYPTYFDMLKHGNLFKEDVSEAAVVFDNMKMCPFCDSFCVDTNEHFCICPHNLILLQQNPILVPSKYEKFFEKQIDLLLTQFDGTFNTDLCESESAI